MEGFTTAVGSAFTTETIFGAITPLIPFIAVVTLAALTWGLFNRYRNKAKKVK